MRKLLIGLGASLLAIGPAAFGQAAAEPAMWKVTDEDSEIYLFGSIHLLNEGPDWRTEALADAMAEADYFYYEIPVDASAQAEMQQLAMQYGVNTDGRTLSSFLSEDEVALANEVLPTLGLQLAQIEALKPWLAYLTVTVMAVQQAGYSAESGIDSVLAAETPDDQERYFETAEQQMQFFANMSDEVQTGLFVVSLEQVQEGSDVFDNMVQAWRDGDVEALDTIVNDSMMETDASVYEKLIVERNQDWVVQIKDLMAGDEEAVIIVGAAHLIGEDGVPTLLEAEGYAVERVQ